MTSVERVMEYGKMRPEAPLNASGDEQLRMDEKVPLEFKDVSLRYAEGEPRVLQGLTLKIQQGEKVKFVVLNYVPYNMGPKCFLRLELLAALVLESHP